MISKVAPPSAAKSFRLLIPVFNDWEAVGKLLQNVDTVLRANELTAEVWIVDDSSKQPFALPPTLPEDSALRDVQILRLRRNLGHQRALAVGLSHLAQLTPALPVVVMDADGEDSPQDIPRLLSELETTGQTKVVFAERTLRSEGPVFRFFYQCYRLLHKLLVGHSIRFGNFSALPPELLHELVIASELWNHYAAAVLKTRLAYTTIPTHRAKRLMGESKMRFIDLVNHGMSALSVFSETVVARMLIVTGLGELIGATAFGAAVGGQFIWDYSLPLSVILTAVIGLCFCTGSLIITVLFALHFLQARVNANFIPALGYQNFVDEIRHVWPVLEAATLRPSKKARKA